MWRALVFLAATGCAIGPGEPMGTLAPRIEAKYTPAPDRDVGDGFQRLASDYQVRVDRFVLSASDFLLVGGGGAAGTAFDPANPPPGYSNCHGGHCHADDGSLPSYEEIAARTGGASASTTAVAIHAGELELVGGSVLEDPACEPDCTLREVMVQRLLAPVSQLAIEGVVRDGRADPRIAERPFSLVLPVAGSVDPVGGDAPVVTLSGALELPVDRESAPLISLSVLVAPGASIFDGVPWDEAVASSDGSFDLASASNLEMREVVLSALASGALSFEVSRRAP